MTSATIPDDRLMSERPRALRRQGLLRRVAPFAGMGLAAIAVTPFVLDETRFEQVRQALLLNVALLAVVLVVPWSRLPRWTEAIPPLAAFPIIALLRDATGHGSSVLTPLGLLIVFWFALNGSAREVLASLVGLFVTLAAPVYLVGAPHYPESELVRAALLTMLAAATGLATQRAMDEKRRTAHVAERIAEIRELANDQLRDAAEIKSQFVAMVSHELRTPLTSIRGFAGTILHQYDRLGDEDRRRFAGIIEEQAERLSRLVEDLLVLSRIELGAASSQPRQLQVVTLLEQVVEQFAAIDIHVHCPAETRVLADPDHVEQMLVNLVANARRYGAPPIEVSASCDGDMVRIAVEDSGPGVEPAFAPLLFDRFTQAGRDTGSGGTGLGLSIVRGLAQANGGNAWYEPREGGGSRFVISLPLADADDPRTPAVDAKDPAAGDR